MVSIFVVDVLYSNTILTDEDVAILRNNETMSNATDLNIQLLNVTDENVINMLKSGIYSIALLVFIVPDILDCKLKTI